MKLSSCKESMKSGLAWRGVQPGFCFRLTPVTDPYLSLSQDSEKSTLDFIHFTYCYQTAYVLAVHGPRSCGLKNWGRGLDQRCTPSTRKNVWRSVGVPEAFLEECVDPCLRLSVPSSSFCFTFILADVYLVGLTVKVPLVVSCQIVF